MKLAELNPLIETLGWTILHSLWQGLVVGSLLFILKRVFRNASSSTRYVLDASALFSIFCISMLTFYHLQGHTLTSPTAVHEQVMRYQESVSVGSWRADPFSLISATSFWVNNHLYEIVCAWLTGTGLFGLRLVVSWWYSRGLQKSAAPVIGAWASKLQELANDLRFRGKVMLAQSRFVGSPILLGYFKPIILLPVGMLSGLSVEQVETILLHELAHLKRHDHIVNFVQSVMEVIFFFNPAVWAISAQLRHEREKCCDDIVIESKNPLTYVQALHQLEEARVWGASVALAATGRKDHLLKRIKRIMEPSEKKEAGRGKMFPAMVVMLALAAAWFSIQAYSPKGTRNFSPNQRRKSPSLQDTSTKDLTKEKYSRHTVTTSDKKGQAHEEIKESFDGDHELQPRAERSGWFDLESGSAPEIAEMPEIEIPEVEIPEIEVPEVEIPEIPEVPEVEQFAFPFQDTIPEGRFGWNERRDWEGAEEQFTEKFRETFSDFYKNNKPEFDKMMKELDLNMAQMQEKLRDEFSVDGRIQKEMERAQRQLQRLGPPQQKRIEENVQRQERNMRRQLEKLDERMAYQGKRMKSIGRNMSAFENELRDQLVRDGYLSKDDKIKNMNWQDDGDIDINGKKIKEQDKAKYRALHKKYFSENGFRHVE